MFLWFRRLRFFLFFFPVSFCLDCHSLWFHTLKFNMFGFQYLDQCMFLVLAHFHHFFDTNRISCLTKSLFVVDHKISMPCYQSFRLLHHFHTFASYKNGLLHSCLDYSPNKRTGPGTGWLPRCLGKEENRWWFGKYLVVDPTRASHKKSQEPKNWGWTKEIKRTHKAMQRCKRLTIA